MAGAADRAYFPAEDNAVKVYNLLERLHPGQGKLWVAKDIGSGGLQAEAAAISVIHDKTFKWLNQVLHIDRVASRSI